jgi:hypothetical protein
VGTTLTTPKDIMSQQRSTYTEQSTGFRLDIQAYMSELHQTEYNGQN